MSDKIIQYKEEIPAPKDPQELIDRHLALVNKVMPVLLEENFTVYVYALCEILASIAFVLDDEENSLEAFIATIRHKFEIKEKNMREKNDHI